MSRIGTIARRSLLIGSAAIAGGVAFGVWKTRQPAPNPLVAGPGGAALNPFVLIDRQGVTLIAPRAEMGQGVRTTWAALIAEELDVELAEVRVLHGPAAQAYYNSALVGEALPLRGYDTSDLVHGIGVALGATGKLISAQLTGGSTSMRDGFVRMRIAGATARETLKQAAADRLGLDRGALRTTSGRVIAPDGTALAYAELAAAAADIEPPQVGLRDPAEWRLLGRSQPRVDMAAKLTGTAGFGIDVRLPGMRFAALRMCPHFGGAMKGFDAGAATIMPGVEAVVDLGRGIAVVATNTWLAMQAAAAVAIDWDEGPAPDDTDALFARLAAAFDAAPNATLRDDGDADARPDGATEVVAEYRVPYLAHATMEPMNATARFDGDRLEVWCGTQAPTLVQWKCAGALGLPYGAVTVHATYLGGGFGRRGEFDFAVHAAQVARALPGVPVQLTWSREEDMRHDFYRPGALARMRGAVRDGRAVLIEGRVASQSVMFAALDRVFALPAVGPDKILAEGLFNQPYAIPNYRMATHIADTAIPVGWWRSVANSHNAFFHESFLDEMAHAAGRDPLEFRLDLARSAWEPAARVLEAVRDMSGWTGRTPEGIGRGVALCRSFGTTVAQVIEVAQDGGAIRIARAWIACDVGLALDPANVEAQMTGAMAYGLSAACFGEITFARGAVEQANFPDYEALRMHTMPRVAVRVLENQPRLGGAGEPGTPPAAPALANALFDLTGRRARALPLNRTFDLSV